MPTFEAFNGRVWGYDGDGSGEDDIFFDTNRRNQIRVGSTVRGTVKIPSRTASDSKFIDAKRTVRLAGVTSIATHIKGYIKVAYSGPGVVGAIGGAGGAGWHSIGGTYVHHFDGQFDYTKEQGYAPSGIALYTFRVASGSIYMDEVSFRDRYDTGGRQGYQMRGFTISYFFIPCRYV